MKSCFALMVATAFLTGSTLAADSTSKGAYDAAKRSAASRYAEDKKLCADESSSSTRMQCLRDAKAEYDATLNKAKTEHASAPAAASKGCAGCGKVLSVRVVEKEGKAGNMGMVAGGVAGALLGNQVGTGTERTVLTVAGAAGGAYAGNKIEQKMKSTKVWEVAVRFENGEGKTYTFEKDPGFASGTGVKASNGSITRR